MKPRRDFLPPLRRSFLLAALLTLLGGPAAFAYWVPVYVDGEYLGCSHISYTDPDSSTTYSPSILHEDECQYFHMWGISTSGGGSGPGDDEIDAARSFIKDFGLNSDADVQKSTARASERLRRLSERLQAGALEAVQAAREVETLKTLPALESWIAELLKPRTCSSPR